MEVIVESYDGLEEWRSLEPILEAYAKENSITIHVQNPHGSTFEPVSKPGTLHIAFWSVPSPTRSKTYSSAFGIGLVPGQVDGFEPVADAIDITDDHGMIVAQVLDDTLYVLFDLPHGGRAAHLMEKILDRYTEVCGNYSRLSKEERRQRLLDRSRSNYKSLFDSRLQKTIDDAQKLEERAEKRITELQEQLLAAIVSRKNKRAEVETAKQLLAQSDPQVIESGYASLAALSSDGQLIVTSSYLEIQTDYVFLDFEGTTYDIGEFAIRIYPNSGRDGGILCYNRTRVITAPSGGKYHHPHVNGDGQCCLGDASELMTDLMMQMKFPEAFMLARSFVHSFNPSGWYVSVTHWPFK